MHVEMGADPGRAPKHAGQKKTYKAIAETYAFLPREAVTRFLMSCGECQKRMHINPSTAEFKENDRPTSLVPDLIDYNMPLTATYLKQMKLQCMTATERDDSSVSSEDMNSTEPTWVAAEQPPVPEPSPPNGERVSNPATTIKEEDGRTSLTAAALFWILFVFSFIHMWNLKVYSFDREGAGGCCAGNSLPCS
uniref:Nucleolar protein 4-like a n=1 Tax=Seriola dumerili TaxID=41447 RepID=A0A3B4T4Q6_SERDU